MSLRDKAKIIKAVDDRAKELSPLYERFDEYYKRITSYRFKMPVEGGQAGGEYDNFTTNKPRTLIKKITNTLSTAPLHIQLEIDGENEEDRKAKNNAERFIYGNINLIDEKFGNLMKPTLQAQLAYFSSLFGFYALRAFISLGDDGYGVPRLAVWNMMGVTFEMGADGLAWGCHTGRVPVSQARAEWGKSIEKLATQKNQIPSWYSSSRTGYVIKRDFWDDETNSVIIDKEWAKRPTDHKLGHTPILIVVAGNAPQPETLTDDIDDIKYWGESALDDNMLGYEQFEKQMTYRQTLVAEGVHAPLGVWSESGKKTLKRSPWGKGRVTSFKIGEEVKPLTMPSTPDDAAALLGVIDDELTLGGAARVLSGIDAPGGSGRRAEVLGAFAAESLLSASKEAIERGIKWFAREFLTQYSEGSFKGLKLRGEDFDTGEKWNVDLKPADIKGDWYPVVKIMPKIPEDTHQKKMDAIALVNAKLLSKATVRDKDLGVRDSDLEGDKINREEAMELPPIKIRIWAARVLEEGGKKNRFFAQAILAEIEKQQSELPAPPIEAEPLAPEQPAGGLV